MKTHTTTEKLYQTIDTWDKSTYDEVWNKWLWGTNGNALPLEQCWDMNEMHIWGILCSIRESVVLSSNAITYTTSEIIPLEEYPELSMIHLHTTKPINDYSLRELLDQLECLQLNWGKIIGALLDNDQIELSLHLLKASMARLGFMARHAFQTEGIILDDVQYVTPLPNLKIKNATHGTTTSTEELTVLSYGVISRKTLRQSICIFFALFRVQFVVGNTDFITGEPDDQIERVIHAIKQHHIESSMDFFNVFQQMVYLAPGMRLVYRTNFTGMYNDVSQVIYFHYPRFCRQPQLPLKDIPGSNIHLLPLLLQLIPDIPVFYDDDTYILGLTHPRLKIQAKNQDGCSSSSSNADETLPSSDNSLTSILLPAAPDDNLSLNSLCEWGWLVSCGEVFLIQLMKNFRGDENNNRKYKIYLSENRSLVNLVAFFLKCTQRKIGDELLDASDTIAQRNHILQMGLTSHGHVQVID